GLTRRDGRDSPAGLRGRALLRTRGLHELEAVRELVADAHLLGVALALVADGDRVVELLARVGAGAVNGLCDRELRRQRPHGRPAGQLDAAVLGDVGPAVGVLAGLQDLHAERDLARHHARVEVALHADVALARV